MTYKLGEILVVQFPYSNMKTFKKRPILVIQDSFRDFVGIRISTKPKVNTPCIPLTDWKLVGLNHPSFIQLDKIATLEKTMVEKRLGELSAQDFFNFSNKWQEVFCSF